MRDEYLQLNRMVNSMETQSLQMMETIEINTIIINLLKEKIKTLPKPKLPPIKRPAGVG